MSNFRYGTNEELKDFLLYKRIVKWNKDQLILEDGTSITIECSDHDCCAYAGGEFKDVVLDAVITDFKIESTDSYERFDEITNYGTVTIYHNQNPIALAECYADNGNGGYYYSIASLVVKDVHFPVVDA